MRSSARSAPTSESPQAAQWVEAEVVDETSRWLPGWTRLEAPAGERYSLCPGTEARIREDDVGDCGYRVRQSVGVDPAFPVPDLGLGVVPATTQNSGLRAPACARSAISVSVSVSTALSSARIAGAYGR